MRATGNWRKPLLLCMVVLIATVGSGCGPTPTEETGLLPRDTKVVIVSPEVVMTSVTEPPPVPRPRPLFHIFGATGIIRSDELIVLGPEALVTEVVGCMGSDVHLSYDSATGLVSIQACGDKKPEEKRLDMEMFYALCVKAYTGLETGPLPELESKDKLELPYLDDLFKKPANRWEAMPQAEGVLEAKRNKSRSWSDSVNGWVMRRYSLPLDTSLTDAKRADRLELSALALNCVAAAKYDAFPLVFADVGYRTGRGPTENNPWIGEGGPWIGEGGGLAPDPVAANVAFWSQWALGKDGLNLPPLEQRNGDGKDLANNTGTGVRVGVFDTAPFAEGPYLVDWVEPEWPLTVHNPGNKAVQLNPPIKSSHGLFVASLIHAVAPNSEIHLYRVLDDTGWGDLFTLNLALHLFIAESLEQAKDYDGVVINLSLGGQTVADLRALFPDEYADSVGKITGEEYDETYLKGIEEVMSLRTLLTAAYSLDMVVVASAGNEGYWKVGEWPDPLIPARFPKVVAVAASQKDGNPACFTHKGDVAAPGGEGANLKDDQGNVLQCMPNYEACKKQNNCQYALIGLVAKSDEYEVGYAYWAGTSFSSPLVSGLAALALEQGVRGAGGKNHTADAVLDKIKAQPGITEPPD